MACSRPQARAEALPVLCRQPPVAGIERELPPAIAQAVDAGRRQLPLERVEEEEEDDLAVPGKARQFPLSCFFQTAKVAEEKKHAAGAHAAGQAFQDAAEGGAGRRGRPRLGQQAQVAQNGVGGQPRPHLPDAGAGEDAAADPVPLASGAPGEKGGGAGGEHRLVGAAGGEEHRRAVIDPEMHRPLPLFAKELGVHPAGAGGNPPIEGARVVPRLVMARLGIFHSPPLEAGEARPAPGFSRSLCLSEVRPAAARCRASSSGRVMRTGLAAGFAAGVMEIRWGMALSANQGTARRVRSRPITISVVIPSASAS